jgi:RNA polymerase sigma-70 factor (ECF subfamily)
MASYDILNKQLNDEMQRLAVLINTGEYTERDRNRLGTIMYPKLGYFISKYIKDGTEVEEAVNETMYKIFKGLKSFNCEYRFTTWMYTIARNEALLWLHNRKLQFAVGIDTLTTPLDDKDDYEKVLERETFFKDLYSVTLVEMEVLPESVEKSMLIDKVINLMKGEELAEKYQMNLNTVKTKIRKAKRILKYQIVQKNPGLQEMMLEYLPDIETLK